MNKTAMGCAFACAVCMAAEADAAHDNFYWLGEINKASIIINSSEGLLEKDEAAAFAKGLDKVLRDGEQDGAERPGLVITFEPLLIDAAGENVTKIHAGRSSQDMLTTCSLMEMREELLNLADELDGLNRDLVALAELHRDTVVPNYTNGVAAQPNSYGHYLLAYAEAFSRDSARIREYYARVNRSPMGTTVLNGTGWPLNRERMASYLGFDDIAYNAYGAVQVYTIEHGVEAGYIASTIALQTGSFIEDIMQQYAQPRPWIMLKEGGGNTYVSSAMPQKRNPGLLNRVRTNASTILGEAAAADFRAHNIPPGMADPRSRELQKMIRGTKKLTADFRKILAALEINPERAREELNLDWTASQEIADVLMKDYGIPFRLGHHFASEMVGYARSNGLTPMTFPYVEAQRIYREAAAGHEGVPAELPLDETAFRACLDPVSIVQNRRTKGGPQPSEMDVMLEAAKQRNAADEAWVKTQRRHIEASVGRLDRDFEAILGNVE